MLTSEKKMEQERFELTLAFHCAPALLGMKPADLISLPVKGEEDCGPAEFLFLGPFGSRYLNTGVEAQR